MGVALKKATVAGPGVLDADLRAFLCGTVAVALLAVALLDAVASGGAARPRVATRGLAALVVGALAFAPLGATALLGLVAVVMAIQVAADLRAESARPDHR